MIAMLSWLPWNRRPTPREMATRTKQIVREIEQVTTKIKSNADRAIELLDKLERRNA
jgi:methyl-accepting chemotaxis protein